MMTSEEAARQVAELYRRRGIHNVNFVTPDHFLPHAVEIVTLLRAQGIELPIVWNVSGYERVELLREIEPYADIYLPDVKYADNTLGMRLSHCADYAAVALNALAEMVRQKGMLDVFDTDPPGDIARRGVLVRHLILPGQTQNSLDALTTLFLEFGKRLPISLMSQYHPVLPCDAPDMRRRITEDEFQQVYDHAGELGFEHLFVQFPERRAREELEFLPDFTRNQPFQGNQPPA